MIEKIKQLTEVNYFAFSQNEDFLCLKSLYINNTQAFKEELTRIITSLKQRFDDDYQSVSQKIWTSLNTIELLLYLNEDLKNVPSLIVKTIDMIHCCDIYHNQDLEAMTCCFKQKTTLYNIIYQCYKHGPFFKFSNNYNGIITSLLSKSDIINTNRAIVFGIIMHYQKKKIPSNINCVLKALNFCDSIYGEGIDWFYSKNDFKSADAKLRYLTIVHLNTLYDNIITYYNCTTNNQRKKHIDSFKKWYASQSHSEMIRRLDDYLLSLL